MTRTAYFFLSLLGLLVTITPSVLAQDPTGQDPGICTTTFNQFYGYSHRSEFGCAYTRPPNSSFNPRNPNSPQARIGINFMDDSLRQASMWIGPLRAGTDGILHIPVRDSRKFSVYNEDGYTDADLHIYWREEGSEDSTLVYTTAAAPWDYGWVYPEYFTGTKNGYLIVVFFDPDLDNSSKVIDLDYLWWQYRAARPVPAEESPEPPAAVEVVLSPNPISAGREMLNLSGISDHVVWEIFDPLGRKITHGTGGEVQLPGDLVPGVYVIRFADDRTTGAKSFTVVR